MTDPIAAQCKAEEHMKNTMNDTDKTFAKWWRDEGRMYDPDTDDVPWFDKRKFLAEIAFTKGVDTGVARSQKHTRNRTVDLDRSKRTKNGC